MNAPGHDIQNADTIHAFFLFPTATGMQYQDRRNGINTSTWRHGLVRATAAAAAAAAASVAVQRKHAGRATASELDTRTGQDRTGQDRTGCTDTHTRRRLVSWLNLNYQRPTPQRNAATATKSNSSTVSAQLAPPASTSIGVVLVKGPRNQPASLSGMVGGCVLGILYFTCAPRSCGPLPAG